MPFVALDRKNHGPWTECYACSAVKKDHRDGECPPSRTIDLVDHAAQALDRVQRTMHEPPEETA